MSESTADRDPFERLAEEFAERLRRGEHPAITEYVARHPEHADVIRELFPEIALVEQHKPARADRGMSLPAPTPAQSGGLPDQFGDYRILRYLGEGGMGVVYEAVRESLRTNVALKVMHPQFRAREKYLRRFRIEARSAARLHHTNIVTVSDYGVHDGVCYYAMQYIAGHSLDKVLADVRRLRHENEASPIVETATMPSGRDGPLRPDRGSVQPHDGDAPMGALRRAVSLGLLTGHWSLTAMSESSHDGERPPRPAASAAGGAIEDVDSLEDRTEPLGPGTDDGAANAAESAGAVAGIRATALRRLALELAQTDGEIGPALEPRALPADAPGRGQPAARDSGRPAPEPSAFAGSASSLVGKSEMRYYREVARLAAQVADALAYAHKRGVLHRDIKPPNLILDALGNIWITDFGLAKFDDGDDLSQSHDLVGTLRYMAPERFRGVSDPRCDLYALGATLYEMLTLQPAFKGDDQLQLIRRIEDERPVPPRQLERGIPADLETIVLRALAKNPDDRFGSAGELGDELRRFVEGRPIRSRPVSVVERFWRWCRREPVLAGASIAAALLTIVLAVGSTWAAFVYRGQVALTRRAEVETRKNLFESLVAQARGTRISRRQGQRFDALKAVRKAVDIARELRLPPDDFDRIRDEAIACLALPDLEPTGQVFTRPSGVIAEAVDSGMTRSAWRFHDGTISVRRIADGGEIARFHAEGDREVALFQFSPDGRFLATNDYPSMAVKVWDVNRGEIVVTDPGSPPYARDPFRPDSRRILASEGTLREYDTATGRRVRTWPGRMARAVYRPDGKQIAAIDVATRPPTCRIFEAESARLIRSFPLRADGELCAWSPDGRTLVTVFPDQKIELWDAVTGAPRATLVGHGSGGVRASFHPAGTLLASNDWDGRLRLWDAILGQPLLSVTGHGWQFSRDGRIVVSLEDRLTIHRFEPALEYRSFAHADREPMNYRVPSIHPDGRILASGADRGLVLWDLADGKELAFLPLGMIWWPLFEPSGDLITCGAVGVQRWPIRLDAGRGELKIGPPRRLPLPESAVGIARDRSGRIVAAADHTHAYVAAPGRTFRVGPLDDCRSVAVSPDGRWLATGSHVRGAQVWRIDEAATDPAKQGTKVVDLPIEGPTVFDFTPDGRWLVTGTPRLRLWRVGTWREEAEYTGSIGCISPDGRTTAIVEPTRIIRLVEFATGRTLARLEGPDLGGVDDLTFSPDGSRLVLDDRDRPAPSVRVWDLRAIRKDLAGLGLDWEALAYPEPDPAAATGPIASLRVAVDLGAFRGLDEEAWSLYHQAGQHEVAGQVGEAIDVYRRMADRSPDLAMAHNALAWLLATAPPPHRRSEEAVAPARRAVELAPGESMYLNTLGVALYRAGRFAEAIPVLEQSLAAGFGNLDGFDLLFLAMAHHRLGHRAAARQCFDRAISWIRERKFFPAGYISDLKMFREEARAVLAGELPDDVFASPR